MAATPGNFPKWLQETMGEDLVGVEVGVAECGNVRNLLKHGRVVKKLYAVDPWKHYAKDIYQDTENVGQDAQDTRYRKACELAEYDTRLIVIRAESEKAADQVPDGSLDFVFIDGNHVTAWVLKDIDAWWPKLREGGLMSGHDYRNAQQKGDVEEAVHIRFKDTFSKATDFIWWVKKDATDGPE